VVAEHHDLGDDNRRAGLVGASEVATPPALGLALEGTSADAQLKALFEDFP
jgi:hypothetical protein